MANFELQIIEEVEGRYTFYKLFKNDVCLFDQFENNIIREGNYENELATIQTIMIRVANGLRVPKKKFNPLKGKKNDTEREFEIKTNNLRVYLFIQPGTGDIVVLGGKKGTQKEDIKKFRNLKKEFLETLNN